VFHWLLLTRETLIQPKIGKRKAGEMHFYLIPLRPRGQENNVPRCKKRKMAIATSLRGSAGFPSLTGLGESAGARSRTCAVEIANAPEM
jgi:hypothetical protein